MIETSDVEEFDWMNKLQFNPKFPSSIRYFVRHGILPTPSPNGVKFQKRDGMEQVEIHRNGCVSSKGYFARSIDEKVQFEAFYYCVSLSHVLQFASALYRRHNFFGNVNITCMLYPTNSTWLSQKRTSPFSQRRERSCQASEIKISREYPTSMVESEFEPTTSNIMDEIFNCYGFWKCPYFDGKRNLRQDMVK